VQEWQDRKEGPTEFMEAYSEVRYQKNFDSRVIKAQAIIPEVVEKGINFSDRKLCVYLFERLVSEKDEAKNDKSISVLEQVLTIVIKFFKNMDIGEKKYLQDFHNDHIKELEETLIKLRQQEPEAEATKEKVKGPELPEPALKYMRPVPLPLWLDYLYFRFTQMFYKKFYGDEGYLYDDSILPYKDVLVHSGAILLRAFMDTEMVTNAILKAKNRETGKFLFEDEFVVTDEYGDPVTDKEGNEIRLGRNIYYEMVGKESKKAVNREKKRWEIVEEGSGLQLEADKAFIEYQNASLKYQIKKKKRGVEKVEDEKAEMLKAKKAYNEAIKDVSYARKEYNKIVMRHFQYKRAPLLRDKKIRGLMREQIEDVTGEEVDVDTPREELESKMKKIVDQVDPDVIQEINGLAKERVYDFMLREFGRLLKRTRHFDEIEDGVNPFLEPLGITFKELLSVADEGEETFDEDEFLEAEELDFGDMDFDDFSTEDFDF